MGREVRRVPPNWEHPKGEDGKYRPLYNSSYSEAIAKWIENHNLWLQGQHPDQALYADKEWVKCKYYAEYAGDPPSVQGYLPDFDEEPTWYQLYETVTEGTPLSPPFETQEELINHLVEYGDFWQYRWSPQQATSFVAAGWAPSAIAYIE